MIRVEITKSGLAAIGRNGFREVGRLAVHAAALYWFKTYLPLHFKNTAYRRYHYAFRDDRYDELKLKRGKWPFGEHIARANGEVLPHVFSGRTRERALSHQNIVSKAPNFQAYYAEVRIDAPAYNFSVNKRIDLRNEVTRFTPQEEQKMERIFAEEWERQLKRLIASTPKQTRRIAA